MNKPGEVIKPDDIKTVEGKGLPFHKQSFKFGNLYVVFKVQFPTSVAAPALTQIGAALAGMKKKEDDTETENEEEESEEEEEEEEEAFEIEIEDVTYFATGEENGNIYEIDSAGDPGKKVGYIKDGEPIFFQV